MNQDDTIPASAKEIGREELNQDVSPMFDDTGCASLCGFALCSDRCRAYLWKIWQLPDSSRLGPRFVVSCLSPPETLIASSEEVRYKRQFFAPTSPDFPSSRLHKKWEWGGKVRRRHFPEISTSSTHNLEPGVRPGEDARV